MSSARKAVCATDETADESCQKVTAWLESIDRYAAQRAVPRPWKPEPRSPSFASRAPSARIQRLAQPRFRSQPPPPPPTASMTRLQLPSVRSTPSDRILRLAQPRVRPAPSAVGGARPGPAPPSESCDAVEG